MKLLLLGVYQFILLAMTGATTLGVVISPVKNDSGYRSGTPAERPGGSGRGEESDAWLALLMHADGRRGCAGGVLAARWLVTAAHCLRSCAARARTRTRDVPVLECRRHAAARARLDGGGAVRDLRHDIGFVSTRDDLVGSSPWLWLAEPRVGRDEEVVVLGVGGGAEWRPFELRMRVSACASPGWRQVACGREPAGARRLCRGDSGSPVYLRGALLAVVSMGPLDCGERLGPAAVFTLLHAHREALLLAVNASGGWEAPTIRVMAAVAPASAPPQKADHSFFISLLLLLALA